MSENVSVKWCNHRKAIYEAVRSLQFKETFADVTLVCENKKVQAHKFVLSACSEYFESQLKELPFRASFFLPAEISEINLMSLLDYIYRGEAIVEEERVDDLLKAAEILKMRGLVIPSHTMSGSGVESEVESNGLKENKDNFTTSSLTLVKKSKNPEELFSSSDCETFEDSQRDVNGMLKVVIKKNIKAHPSPRDIHNERRANPDPRLVCPHCQRQFYWRSNLTKHIRTHTGEKPYTCPECSYKTGYSEALKRHLRVHTGEKPYECSLCDYKCKDNNSLKLHMNKHTGKSSFSCNYCSYKTRIKSAYFKHLMANHDYNDYGGLNQAPENRPITEVHSTVPTLSHQTNEGPLPSPLTTSHPIHPSTLHPMTSDAHHSVSSSHSAHPILSDSHHTVHPNDPYGYQSVVRSSVLQEPSLPVHCDAPQPLSTDSPIYSHPSFHLHSHNLHHPSPPLSTTNAPDTSKGHSATDILFFEAKVQQQTDLSLKMETENDNSTHNLL